MTNLDFWQEAKFRFQSWLGSGSRFGLTTKTILDFLQNLDQILVLD